MSTFPTAEGIAEAIIETLFDSMMDSIDGFATDFLSWLGGVRDPTQNDLLVDAWFAVFEIALAVLVIWIVLGLLSFPFGDDQKTDLYRLGWRTIGVFIIFAIAQPAFAFGAELSEEIFQMIFTLTEEGADINAEFDGLTDAITSGAGAGTALLIAGIITSIVMVILQLVVAGVMLAIDYIYWTAFVFSPLLAVFWLVDWGPLAKANDFAETMFDAAVGSLLYPVAISIFATAYVVLVGAGVQGGLNDSTITAMVELTALSILFPIIILAVGFKLLSQIGEGMYGLSTVGKMAGVAVTAGAASVVGGLQGAAAASGSGGSSIMSGAASGMRSGAQSGAQMLARGGMGPTNEPISSVGQTASGGGGGGTTSRGGASASNGSADTGNTQAQSSGGAIGRDGQSTTNTTTASEEPKRAGLVGKTASAVSSRTPASVKRAGSSVKGAAERVSPRPSTQRNRKQKQQQEALEATAEYQETANELEQAEEGDTVNLDELKEQGVFEEAEAPAPSDGEGEVTVGEAGWVEYENEDGDAEMAKTDNLALASSKKADQQRRKAERAERQADIANKGSQAASGVASGIKTTGQMAGKVGMMGARDVVMGHPGYTDFSMGETSAGGQTSDSSSGATSAGSSGEESTTERASTSVSPTYFKSDSSDRVKTDAAAYQSLNNDDRVDLESDEDEDLAVVRDPEQSSDSEADQVGWAMPDSQAQTIRAQSESPEEQLEQFREQGTRIARTGDDAPDIPTEGSMRGYANVDVATVDSEETVLLDDNSDKLADSEVRPEEFDDAEVDKVAAVRGEYQEQPGGGAYIEGTNGSRVDLAERLDQQDPGDQALAEGGVQEQDDGSKTLNPSYQPSKTTGTTATNRKQKTQSQSGSDDQNQGQEQEQSVNTPSGGVVPLGKKGISLPDNEKQEIAGQSVDYIGSVDDTDVPSTYVNGIRVDDNTSDGRFSDENGQVDIGGAEEDIAISNAELQEYADGNYQIVLTDDTIVDENPSDLSAQATEDYAEDEEIEELRWGDETTNTDQVTISESSGINTLSAGQRATFDGESVDVTGEIEEPDIGRTKIAGIDVRDESESGRFVEDGTLNEIPAVEEGKIATIENARYTVEEGMGGTEREVIELTDQSRITTQEANGDIEPSIRRGEATTEVLSDEAPVTDGSINAEEMDYVSNSRELEGMAVDATGVVGQRPSGEVVLEGEESGSGQIAVTDDTRDGDTNRAEIGEGKLENVEQGDTVSLNQSVVDSEGRQLRLIEESSVEDVNENENVPTPTVTKDYPTERLTEDRSEVRPTDADTLAKTDLETAFEGGEEVSMQEVTFVEDEMSGKGPVENSGRFETPDGRKISDYSRLEYDPEPAGDQLEDGGTYEINSVAVDDEGRLYPSQNTELTRLGERDNDTDANTSTETTVTEMPEPQNIGSDGVAGSDDNSSTMRQSQTRDDSQSTPTQSNSSEPNESRANSGDDSQEKVRRTRDREGSDLVREDYLRDSGSNTQESDDRDESEDN